MRISLLSVGGRAFDHCPSVVAPFRRLGEDGGTPRAPDQRNGAALFRTSLCGAAGDPLNRKPERAFDRAGALSRTSTAPIIYLYRPSPARQSILHRVLSKIRPALGKKAGVVLDPATPPELVEYVLPVCDIILVMTVNPVGGKLLPEMLPKDGACARSKTQPLSVIEVNGATRRQPPRPRPPATAIVAAEQSSGLRTTPRRLPTSARGGPDCMNAVPCSNPDRDALKRAAAEAAAV